MYKEQLQHIGRQIITAATIEEELTAAKRYSEFLIQLPDSADETLRQYFNTEIRLEGGFALSPLHAIRCVKEYIRTARFIKGTYLAIRELQQRFPGQRLQVLYAGCGPYATLLLPVMPLFSADEIEVIMLDIHEYSTTSVQHLVAALGLTTYVSNIIRGDAIRYRHPADEPLHLVVTETMYYALAREPQAAITANLAPQLLKNGILIPEEISIDLVYTFYANEPVFNPDTDERPKDIDPGTASNRMHLGTLFSLNKHRNFSDLYHQSLPFESSFFKAPKDIGLSPDVCLFTTVIIYNNIKLGLAESTITNPYCVYSLLNMPDGEQEFNLAYHFTHIPEWSLLVKDNNR